VLPVCAGVWIALSGPGGRAFGAATIAAGALATPVFLWQSHETIGHSLSQRFEAPDDDQHYVVFIAMNPPLYTADLVQNLPGQERVLRLVSEGEEKDRAFLGAIAPQATEIAHDHRGSLWRLTAPAR
jgi:hypothetical protein